MPVLSTPRATTLRTTVLLSVIGWLPIHGSAAPSMRAPAVSCAADSTSGSVPRLVSSRRAMLEGLKGDAGEVTRLAAQTAAGNDVGTLEPAGQLPQATTVRRGDTATNQHPSTGTFRPGRRAL